MWKAADTLRPDHFVALKVFPEPDEHVALIRHELTQVLRLNDPKAGWPESVVPVVDFQLEGDRPWIMYEYVGGGTLGDRIVQWGSLPDDERVQRALTAWRGLARSCALLHELTPPLVHRDLKPENILCDPVTRRLKITDLGIGGAANAHELELERTVARNAAGVLPSRLLGSHTALYASPEQRRGAPPDPRDDVHALGVIAFQMLTGKLDAAPAARFERELREIGTSTSVINLVGDCVDADVSRRPGASGEVLSRLSDCVREHAQRSARRSEAVAPPHARRLDAGRAGTGPNASGDQTATGREVVDMDADDTATAQADRRRSKTIAIARYKTIAIALFGTALVLFLLRLAFLRPRGGDDDLGKYPVEYFPVVTKVEPGSVADLAGIRVGDSLLSYDGIPLYTEDETNDELIRARNLAVGKSSVAFVVSRSGIRIEFKVPGGKLLGIICQASGKPRPWNEPRPMPWTTSSGSSAGESATCRVGSTPQGVIHFRWCPPGQYQRGSTVFENEAPVETVTISKGFWLAQTETTQSQWKAAGFENPSQMRGGDLPVETSRGGRRWNSARS